MVRTRIALAALAVASMSPLICVADPVPAPPPPIFAPMPQQVTITNAGAPAILHVSISPVQGVPQGMNQLPQPLYPGVSQSIALPAVQECCFQIQAVYADGHTVTVPFWNITNIPTITIHQ